MMARPKNRAAFTLVELLVVITVIGILVGMLLVALGPARNRVGEYVIQQEMVNMSSAFEDFKTAYGFYPPDFTAFRDVDDTNRPQVEAAINALLPFINRIAPQHAELTRSIPADPTSRYIDNWWYEIGTHLDAESGIVFWLSGIAKNKQFPLTNPTTLLPLSPHPFDVVNDSGIDRDVRFDFQTDRIHVVDPAFPRIVHYDQPSGNDEAAYRYFRYTPTMMDAAGGVLDLTQFDGYDNGTFPEPIDATSPARPSGFQLVAAGMDGLFGGLSDDNFDNWNNVGKNGEDDMVNFISDGSVGRLDRKLMGTD